MATPPAAPLPPLADDVRRLSLRETLAAAPVTSALRVFAYGSLIWSPCFEIAGRERAAAPGFHRSFSIWSVHARGTPERPGLGYGLEARAGGRCDGVVFTLPKDTTEEALIPLWEREMWADCYRPVWIELETAQGRSPAVTFVIDPAHRMHVGDLPISEKAAYIAAAHGKFGPCRSYLFDAWEAFRAAGVEDPETQALVEAVRAIEAHG